MKRFLSIAAAVVMMLGLFAPGANATALVDFIDAEGVMSLDWDPGNALAVDAIPVAQSPEFSSFTLFYQGSLGTYQDENGQVISGTGLNSEYEITLVAGFGEQAQQVSEATTFFSLDPDGEYNYFEMYYDSNLNSNPLSGTGYDDGTLIMSGYATSVGGAFSIIDTNIVAMDQFGVDNYATSEGTIGTWANAGGQTSLAGVVEYTNTDFITTPVDLFISDLFFTTQVVVPFWTTNPSQVFDVGQGGVITPNYGPGIDGFYATNGVAFANGDSSDFQFLADASNRFAVIPEPSTILLFGIGLLGIAGIGRKKIKK